MAFTVPVLGCLAVGMWCCHYYKVLWLIPAGSISSAFFLVTRLLKQCLGPCLPLRLFWELAYRLLTTLGWARGWHCWYCFYPVLCCYLACCLFIGVGKIICIYAAPCWVLMLQLLAYYWLRC